MVYIPLLIMLAVGLLVGFLFNGRDSFIAIMLVVLAYAAGYLRSEIS